MRLYQLRMEVKSGAYKGDCLVGNPELKMDHAWACRFKNAQTTRKNTRFYLVEVPDDVEQRDAMIDLPIEDWLYLAGTMEDSRARWRIFDPAQSPSPAYLKRRAMAQSMADERNKPIFEAWL